MTFTLNSIKLLLFAKKLMFEETWKEIADAPGEIYDLPEMKDIFDDEEEFDDKSVSEDFDVYFTCDY